MSRQKYSVYSVNQVNTEAKFKQKLSVILSIGLVNIIGTASIAHADELSTFIATKDATPSAYPVTRNGSVTNKALSTQPVSNAIGNGVGVISSNSHSTIRRIQPSTATQPTVYRTAISQPTSAHNRSLDGYNSVVNSNSIDNGIRITPVFDQNLMGHQADTLNQDKNFRLNKSQPQYSTVQSRPPLESITTTNSVSVSRPSTQARPIQSSINPLVQQQTRTYSAAPDAIAAHIQRLEQRSPSNYANPTSSSTYPQQINTSQIKAGQAKVRQSNSALSALRKLNPFRRQTATPNTFFQNYANAPNIDTAHIGLLYNAEQSASYSAKSVLKTVRQMALENREIVSGSCWDYLNAAFQRAGVSKETLFKGEYPYGPFASTHSIQPGDWLYYVNHSYNDGEHSGLFVGWVDESQNQALILSYAGGNRQEPARYRVYDISHIYNVMRPV